MDANCNTETTLQADFLRCLAAPSKVIDDMKAQSKAISNSKTVNLLKFQIVYFGAELTYLVTSPLINQTAVYVFIIINYRVIVITVEALLIVWDTLHSLQICLCNWLKIGQQLREQFGQCSLHRKQRWQTLHHKICDTFLQ